MMDAAPSSSAPADTDTVPSRGLGTDYGPDLSPSVSDTDTSTAGRRLVALDALSQVPEQRETVSPSPLPTSDIPLHAPRLTATEGPPPPVHSPSPPPTSVPMPRSRFPDARDSRPARMAQQEHNSAKDTSVCPTCKGGGRNLVVCIDGTSNQFGNQNTNVVKLYSHLVKRNDRQLTFYNSGIGTYARPSWRSFSYYKQVIANKLDLAFALRFEKIVLGSYQWLADNYVEGDRIFLFGFSRGAYQVRALSAMIDRMGLIHKGNADQIPFAYELYSHEGAEGNPLSNMLFGVFEQVIHWAIYDLTVAQHLWVAWQTTGSFTTMKRVTIWMVIMLGFLQWIWTVGKNGTPKAVYRTVSVDHDGPRTPVQDHNSCHVTATTPLMGQSPSEAGKERQKSVREKQERFKRAFARNVKVHFVGAWDTVSSVGVVRDKTLPGTTDGMQHVCYFRHALALHERRVKFLPEFVHGGLGPLNIPGHYDILEEIRETVVHAMHEIALGGSDPRTLDVLLAVASALSIIANAFFDNLFPASITPTEHISLQQRDPPHTKEVWFHGSHSDIGGGSSPNERMEKSGPALHWMSFEARLAGLCMSTKPGFLRSRNTELVRTSSLSPFWRLVEFMPITRLTYNGAYGTTIRPHLSSKRRVQPGQLVYGGLSERVKAKLCGAGIKIEHDPYLEAEDLLKHLRHRVMYGEFLRASGRAKIDALSSSVPGQQQLRDMKEEISIPLADMLRNYKGHKGDERQSTQDVFAIQRLLYGLEYSFDDMVNSRPLYEILGSSSANGTWAFPRPVTLHNAGIASLLYLSGDEERVISCDWTGSKKTWDMSTGQPTGTSKGSENIWAVSPDGRYAVKAIYGDTLEVLALNSGDVYARLSDPPDASYGAIFSPDFCLVASGTDKGIRLWDIRGRLVRNTTSITTSTTLSSSRVVFALAFSSKGEYLAAGGLDAAIHIWDMKHRDIYAGDLVGHTHWVRSVMFSPDDARLVSASYDGTVRIWHRITRDTLHVFETLHVLSGHLSGVRTAAFSPNGQYVASGSLDLSVRIWDTATGQLVGVPLNGHTSPIGCVIFSGDGTRVISGAKDGTIRIWDRMPAVPYVSYDIPAPFPVPVLMPVVEPTSQPEMVSDAASDAPRDAVGASEVEPVADSELKTESDGADSPSAASGSQVPSGPGVGGSEGAADAQASHAAPGPSESRGARGAGESSGPESLVGEDEQGANVAPDSHAAEPEDSVAPTPVVGATETVPAAGDA